MLHVFKWCQKGGKGGVAYAISFGSPPKKKKKKRKEITQHVKIIWSYSYNLIWVFLSFKVQYEYVYFI